MGICSSCLGRNRDPSDEDDNSRLLFEDSQAINYGSFGDHNPSALQTDPQDVQRETEALQKIVAQTSNHLVDIFAMLPQNLQRSPTTTYSGQDARLLQYQNVLAKVSTEDLSKTTGNLSAGGQQDATEWASDDEVDDAMQNYRVVRSRDMGPLLGGFADVERSIK